MFLSGEKLDFVSKNKCLTNRKKSANKIELKDWNK